MLSHLFFLVSEVIVRWNGRIEAVNRHPSL
jgi:hypothetical protein